MFSVLLNGKKNVFDPQVGVEIPEPQTSSRDDGFGIIERIALPPFSDRGEGRRPHIPTRPSGTWKLLTGVGRHRLFHPSAQPVAVVSCFWLDEKPFRSSEITVTPDGNGEHILGISAIRRVVEFEPANPNPPFFMATGEV